MIENRQHLGQKAENQALVYLEKQGLWLLQRNFRCPLGEIDLIMQDQEGIVFIEVRYRSNLEYGNPIESVTKTKQQRLIRTACYFLKQKRGLESLNYRFDIIGINKTTHLEWIQNAFELRE
jgi:putative endonuclease